MTTTNNAEALPEVFSVKVGKQPGMVTIKKVSNGSTAGDVLRLAELDARDHELRINGVPANVSHVLKPNDAVLLFKPLAGNSDEVFSVKVGKQPGMVTIKKVSNGSTAGDVLRLAELDARDHELRINGVPANVSQVLKPNDAVLLFKPLAGNNNGDALGTVLEQVHRLQEQANLSDAERANRLRLQGEVQSKQGDLEKAIERLRASISVCAQTSARVGAVSEIGKSLATEMAALPTDLQSQCGAVTEQLAVLSAKLTELAASCQNDQAAARAEVESKASALQNAKDALAADIAKHRVSPEDAVNSAEAALAEAERVAAQK